MQAIIGIIVEKGLSFLASLAMSYFKLEGKISKTKSKHKQQADDVNEIVKNINAKLDAGLPVSEDLWKALKDASYRLNSNFY